MEKDDVLKEIVQKKKESLLLAMQALPEGELKARIKDLPATRSFMQALHKTRQISLIAEIKKASPSKGVIRENFNLEEIAAAYHEADVQAISVLTESHYFAGDILYLNRVKAIAAVPVLRKDFIFEPYQVYESRAFGADAILLISELLSREKIIELAQLAESLGLACLVEVHTARELKKVLKLKAPIIGINNRDLHTLEVDFRTTEDLFALIPKDRTVVVESGIKSYQDVLFLKILGAHACLIGEVFMQAKDVRAKVDEIMSW